VLHFQQKAPDIYVDSVANWIDGTRPVTEAESHFLDSRDVIVSLTQQQSPNELLERYLEKNWYQYFIPKVVFLPRKLYTLELISMSGLKDHKMKSQAFPNSRVEFYSTTSIRRAARLIMTFLVVLSLVIALVVLQYCRSPNVKLAFIIFFVFGFAAMMSVLTKSRTYEITAAMAA
jgi:hypothetical protein